MNKKRLQKLADHLRTVPAAKLDMNIWSCGTSACAMGHACTIPSFKRAGLRLVRLENAEGKEHFYPDFKGASDFGAAEEFFDIKYSVAEHLFSSFEYRGRPSPATVAKRIESVIAKG